MKDIDLSLLVAYRKRPLHLKCMLEWFAISSAVNAHIELIIVEYSLSPSITATKGRNIKYFHVPGDGIFNKSKLLNIGLKNSSGKMVAAYDVDWVPVDLSFRRHLMLAEKSEDLLVAGHRLNYPEEYLNSAEIEQARYSTSVAKEDCSEKYLRMQLIEGQRFGILPLFSREILLETGAWDEAFEGWGGEDQDVIERYLGNSRYLVKCPDLLYIHLNHGKAEGWNDAALIEKNNALYYSKRGKALHDKKKEQTH